MQLSTEEVRPWLDYTSITQVEGSSHLADLQHPEREFPHACEGESFPGISRRK